MAINTNSPHISVVIPVYKCDVCIEELTSRLISTITTITDNFEIIFVDDASPDNSWTIITQLGQKNNKIKGIKLSKNFGQHNAITAGLYATKGEWIVVMDCDLQDRPEEIINLYKEAHKGFDIVLGAREYRQDTILKILYSYFFHKVLESLSGMKFNYKVGNFGIYHRKVIDAIISMPEQLRIFTIMVNYVGFKKSTIPVQHNERKKGKSSYNLLKLTELALRIILSYSNRPLIIIIVIGLLISLFSSIFIAYILFAYYTGRIQVSGYATITVLIAFFSGIIISLLGIIALYIGKIFDQVKNRPLFICSEKINL